MPPVSGRIKLGDFAKLVGENRETLRGRMFRDESPIEPDPIEGEKQRTYDAADIIAYELFGMLIKAGTGLKVAGEAVRLSGASMDFLHRNTEVGLWFVFGTFSEKELSGIRQSFGWIRYQMQGLRTSNEVAEMMKLSDERFMKIRKVTAAGGGAVQREIIDGGIRQFQAVPMALVHSNAKARAEEAGFILDGKKVFKIAQNKKSKK